VSLRLLNHPQVTDMVMTDSTSNSFSGKQAFDAEITLSEGESGEMPLEYDHALKTGMCVLVKFCSVSRKLRFIDM
jgi:hypothetical protein